MTGLFNCLKSLLHDGSFAKFLKSDSFPTVVALIIFSAISIDRDQTYTILIQNPQYFRLYEGNEIIKNFAGTSYWYLLSLKDILFYSIILIVALINKKKKVRFAIFLIALHFHTSYISWWIETSILIESVILFGGIYFIYLWNVSRKLKGKGLN